MSPDIEFFVVAQLVARTAHDITDCISCPAQYASLLHPTLPGYTSPVGAPLGANLLDPEVSRVRPQAGSYKKFCAKSLCRKKLYFPVAAIRFAIAPYAIALYFFLSLTPNICSSFFFAASASESAPSPCRSGSVSPNSAASFALASSASALPLCLNAFGLGLK